MRPINLTISAFGPYKDKVVIPMHQLGTQGLYVITGDTGAGKTTIFDAITFALLRKVTTEPAQCFVQNMQINLSKRMWNLSSYTGVLYIR